MKKPAIIVPDGCREVLLHACCAPCSSAIVEWLVQHDIRPTIFYYNPNIYPLEESITIRISILLRNMKFERTKANVMQRVSDSLGLMATTTTSIGVRMSVDLKESQSEVVAVNCVLRFV